MLWGLGGRWGTEDTSGRGGRGAACANTFPQLTSVTPAASKVPEGNYNSSIDSHHSAGPGHGIALRPSRAKSRLGLGPGGRWGPGHHPAPSPSRSG